MYYLLRLCLLIGGTQPESPFKRLLSLLLCFNWKTITQNDPYWGLGCHDSMFDKKPDVDTALSSKHL